MRCLVAIKGTKGSDPSSNTMGLKAYFYPCDTHAKMKILFYFDSFVSAAEIYVRPKSNITESVFPVFLRAQLNILNVSFSDSPLVFLCDQSAVVPSFEFFFIELILRHYLLQRLADFGGTFGGQGINFCDELGEVCIVCAGGIVC